MGNKRIPAVLVLMGMLLLIAGPAAADKGGVPASFYAIATDCEVVDPGTEYVDAGGMLHIQGQRVDGFVQSDNPLVAGKTEVEINLDINTKTNNGKARVNLTIWPASVDGTWVGPGVSGAGLPSPVIQRVEGTSALAGLRMDFRAKPLDGYPGPGQPPCAEPIRVFEFRGVILDMPGSR